MSQIKFKEQATPATPEAGTVVLYAKADGLLYMKGDDGVEKSVRPVGGGTGDLLSDGSVAMTADWDMGGYRIRSHQFYADASSGTAPLLVASSTLVNNLNADLLDNYQAASFVLYTATDLTGADWMLDEDDLVSDDATKVPSQQSVKAYADTAVTKYIGQNLQIGTSYELVLGDAGKVIEMNNASPNTLNIPANASVAFPVDTRIDVIQYGAGATTITITTDTLTGTATIGGQYEMVSLWKRAATEWVVIGGA